MCQWSHLLLVLPTFPRRQKMGLQTVWAGLGATLSSRHISRSTPSLLSFCHGFSPGVVPAFCSLDQNTKGSKEHATVSSWGNLGENDIAIVKNIMFKQQQQQQQQNIQQKEFCAAVVHLAVHKFYSNHRLLVYLVLLLST